MLNIFTVKIAYTAAQSFLSCKTNASLCHPLNIPYFLACDFAVCNLQFTSNQFQQNVGAVTAFVMDVANFADMVSLERKQGEVKLSYFLFFNKNV